MMTLRRTAFAGGLVGFAPAFEGEVPVRWTIDLLVYDDALTQHAFNTGLRQLLTKHLEILDAFNDFVAQNGAAVGGRPASGFTASATGSTGYL
jgi:hypothetical protein